MRALFVLVCLAVGSGCIARRNALVDERTPVAEATSPLHWRVGSLHVSYQLLDAAERDQTKEVDASPLEQSVHDRLRATLAAQAALGFDERTPQYALEVEVKEREHSILGRQIALGVVLQVGVSVLGMILGPAIGLASKPPNEPIAPTFLNSFLIGSGIGLTGGVVAALFPESSAFEGELEAKLVLRRLADRIVIGERAVRTTWRSDFNAFGVERKLDLASGRGVVALEKAVLEGLQALLEDAVAAETPATP